MRQKTFSDRQDYPAEVVADAGAAASRFAASLEAAISELEYSMDAHQFEVHSNYWIIIRNRIVPFFCDRFSGRLRDPRKALRGC